MQVLTASIRTPNVHPAERWISVAGGAFLAVHGFRRGARGIPEVLAGVMMLHRGITGKSEVYRALGIRTTPWEAALPYELGVLAKASITIAQPRQKVYAFWRDFENLPRFLRHVISVESRDGKHTHWVAEGPMGRKVAWDAEIINEFPNELIAWKSLPGADVDSAGSVRFSDAPGGRGTQVRVELQYNPPAGVAGAYIAKLFGHEPGQAIVEDMHRMKQFLETGEIASTAGQSKGSRHMKTSERFQPDHEIEEAFT